MSNVSGGAGGAKCRVPEVVKGEKEKGSVAIPSIASVGANIVKDGAVDRDAGGVGEGGVEGAVGGAIGGEEECSEVPQVPQMSRDRLRENRNHAEGECIYC